jgi:lipoate-protein ligase A
LHQEENVLLPPNLFSSSVMTTSVVISQMTCPFANAALEHWLFLTQCGVTLMLWRNERSVIIGRNQQVHLECNVRLCRHFHVPVMRRYSGGGAVYHDLDNSNYSLQMPIGEFKSLDLGCRLVRDAVDPLGYGLSISERHDLWLGGRKVSGSAYRVAHGRAYHHGTLLRGSDLPLLQRLLRLDETSLDVGEDDESKSILGVFRSVKSPVGAVPITHEQFCQAMRAAFRAKYSAIAKEQTFASLPPEALPIYDDLQNPAWIFHRQTTNPSDAIQQMSSKIQNIG